MAFDYSNFNEKLFVKPSDVDQLLKVYPPNRIKFLQEAIFANFTLAKSAITEPSNGTLSFNNGILQLNTVIRKEGYKSLIIIINKYFENFHLESNTFWTNTPSNIVDFFHEGLGYFKKVKFHFEFNFDYDTTKTLVNILLDGETVDSALYDKLCSKFEKIKKSSWPEFRNKLTQEYNEEVESKRVEEVTSFDLPDDWTNLFEGSEETKGVFASSISDALILSLNNLGEVNIEYMAEITGEDCKTVIESLKGSIYQNPETWDECFYKGWETADNYLSGRVYDKWKIAVEANKKYNGYFKDNVEALKKIKPVTIDENEIYVTLGSPWIPTDVIDDFIIELFGKDWSRYFKGKNRDKDLFTTYDINSGTWEVPKRWKSIDRYNLQYSTNRVTGVRLVEQALNMKTPYITDTCVTVNGKKTSMNKEETLLAREKQKAIIEEFQKWIWSNPTRKKRLMDLYYEMYCSTMIRKFDGSFLTFPDMNPDIKLFDYQKDAVARIMFSPNTMLAHNVGAGKTYVMVTAGMEKRRIGISKKNLYLVPNTLVGQWATMFKKIYPNANVLAIEPKHFVPSKRQEVLKKIRDEDFDGIIMAYSSFNMISLSKQFYIDKIQIEIVHLVEKSKLIKKSAKENLTKINKLQKEINELQNKINSADDNIYFEDLGINSLFVDEAHNFKNIPLATKSSRVLGVSNGSSKKCEEMLDKVHFIQKKNNGGGVVFATGTPITNSLSDIYAMQKYLQSGQLALLNLQSFDSWIGMFAEQEVGFEIDVDTNTYRMATRFSKFHNMPELSALLASVTDFYNIDPDGLLPEMDGYTDVKVDKSNEFKKYLEEISTRADKIRNHKVKRNEDNMLKLTTDGRKAALDMRLVGKNTVITTECKTYKCAENVYRIYRNTEKDKSTQLVFCDSSTPKKEFNVYDELKRLLIQMGVKESEIAYIHDANTDAQRLAIFKKVQEGTVRILIGSTAKLGLGVNVQDKLIALHHLDIPWRPSDMIQREGRILRKGNENDMIEIYRYITDGSFDAYSWQLLEAKQKMIRDILSGAMPKRMCEELDDLVLNYGEIKALAIGNPLLKERVEASNELNKITTLQKKYVEKRQRLEVELANIPVKLKLQRKLITNCKLDMKEYEECKVKLSNEERVRIRKDIFMAILNSEDANEEVNVCNYQGFDVIVPRNVLKEKMIVYLVRNGRYMVEMGDSEVGILIRIDNFLEGFETKIIDEEEILKQLNIRNKNIKLELEKDESYIERIEELKQRVIKIDEELGVNKNE